MIAGFDPTEIVACAMRPTGSWTHMVTLVAFVVATWFVSRSTAREAKPSR